MAFIQAIKKKAKNIFKDKSEIQFVLDKRNQDSSSPVFKDLVDYVDSTVVDDMLWYRQNTGYPRFFHRIAGTLVIVLSVSIPLIVILPPFPSLIYPGFPSRDFVLATFGVLIALFSGLDSFFHWGELYRVNMVDMVKIKNCLGEWQLEMLTSLHQEDKNTGNEMAVAATRKLFSNFKDIDFRNAEDHARFFVTLDKKS
jgi:hypothetical protein